VWLITAGVVLLALVAVDVLTTTPTIGTTAGPSPRRVLGLARRAMLHVHRRGGGRRRLSTAGVLLRSRRRCVRLSAGARVATHCSYMATGVIAPID
jgi:hypothetical protein